MFRKVREALGLDRCSRCFTGAAPITRDTLEFFLSLNIPVYELYGMSESSGPHAVSIDKAYKMARLDFIYLFILHLFNFKCLWC